MRATENLVEKTAGKIELKVASRKFEEEEEEEETLFAPFAPFHIVFR
jgi:hypothetical protein